MPFKWCCQGTVWSAEIPTESLGGIGTPDGCGEADDEFGAADEVGGAREDRTPDLYNAIVALSQLSYGPADKSRLYYW